MHKQEVKNRLEAIKEIPLAADALEIIRRLEKTCNKLERKRKLNAQQVAKLSKKLKGNRKSISTLDKRSIRNVIRKAAVNVPSLSKDILEAMKAKPMPGIISVDIETFQKDPHEYTGLMIKNIKDQATRQAHFRSPEFLDSLKDKSE